jgi:hypothetical protein
MEGMLEKNLISHKHILCILCRHRHKVWCRWSFYVRKAFWGLDFVAADITTFI